MQGFVRRVPCISRRSYLKRDVFLSLLNGSKKYILHIIREDCKRLTGGQRLLKHTLCIAIVIRREERENKKKTGNEELSIFALLVYICIIKYMYIRADIIYIYTHSTYTYITLM